MSRGPDRRACALLAVALAVFAACERGAGSRVPAGAVRPAAGSPLSPEARRTTHGAIALANLDGEIAVLEASIAKRPESLREVVALVDALLTRGAVRGRLADYDRVATLGESAVARHPRSADAFLLRARSRAALHRFDPALADLADASELGAPARAVEAMRRGILEETGAAPPDPSTAEAEPAPDLLEMGQAAVRAWRQGRPAEAERLFADAQHHDGDVSPFPFAWLYFRQGTMWEELGNRDRARELYEAALLRLPGYAPVISRLAGVEAASGRRDRAIGLLRPLVETSDDPEYAGQLAALLREAGEVDEAERYRRAAADGFDAWLARHPEAFAAKASRFWLEVGGDPARALALARTNLEVRRSPADHELVTAAEAALADATASF